MLISIVQVQDVCAVYNYTRLIISYRDIQFVHDEVAICTMHIMMDHIIIILLCYYMIAIIIIILLLYNKLIVVIIS